MDDYAEYSVTELVRMLGARFKDYRLRANMTQKEVAEMAGLSVLTIHRFENGAVKNISLGTFLLLANSPHFPYTLHVSRARWDSNVYTYYDFILKKDIVAPKPIKEI